MRSRTLLVAGAVVFLGVAVVLALRNVEVRVDEVDLDGSTGAVACVIAPWDAVVNDERAGPGGEHAPEWEAAVGAACAQANDRRFGAAVTSATLGMGVLGFVGARRRRAGAEGAERRAYSSSA